MASNANRGPTGSPLSANSQISSLNTQSCKNLEGGNLTNLAIQQKTNSQWTKEGKKKKGEEEKRKAFTTPCNGVSDWRGEGTGRNLHINVHSTKQWNSISMPNLNEPCFLFPKNHSLHPLVQAWTLISQTLAVPTEVHPGKERLFLMQTAPLWVMSSEAARRALGRWAGGGLQASRLPPPWLLTASCLRAS